MGSNTNKLITLALGLLIFGTQAWAQGGSLPLGDGSLPLHVEGKAMSVSEHIPLPVSLEIQSSMTSPCDSPLPLDSDLKGQITVGDQVFSIADACVDEESSSLVILANGEKQDVHIELYATSAEQELRSFDGELTIETEDLQKIYELKLTEKIQELAAD